MLAGLGRVIYWFCCGAAVLLAIVPAIFNRLPLLTKAPPPLSEVDKAEAKINAKEPTRILYDVKFPQGPTYKIEYLPAKPSSGRLEAMEELERRGALPSDLQGPLDEARKQLVLSDLRAEIEKVHARARASIWSEFSVIVPLCLMGTLALFLFGRDPVPVKY